MHRLDLVSSLKRSIQTLLEVVFWLHGDHLISRLDASEECIKMLEHFVIFSLVDNVAVLDNNRSFHEN